MAVKGYELDSQPVQVFITGEHSKVHGGRMFTATYFWSSVATTPKNLHLNPDGNGIHLRGFNLENESGKADVTIYEGPVTTSNGTSVTCTNLNRFSDNECSLLIANDVVTSSNGVSILAVSNFASAANKGAGLGSEEGIPEFVLHSANTYLIQIEPITSMGDARLSITWYET